MKGHYGKARVLGQDTLDTRQLIITAKEDRKKQISDDNEFRRAFKYFIE